MKKECVLFAILFFFNTYCYGQSADIQRLHISMSHEQDSSRYVNDLNKLGLLLYDQNIDSAFYYTIQAREIAERLGYDHGKADAVNNLGIGYSIKGNSQLALRYFREAYNSFMSIRDSSSMEQTLMNIAIAYKQLGKNAKAISNFNAAMVLGRSLSNDSIIGMVIYNYVLEYPDSFSPDSINYYISKARSIALKYNDQGLRMAVGQLIADEEIKSNRPDGLAHLRAAIAKAIDSNLYYSSLDWLIDLGDQLSNSDSIGAVNAYTQGLTIANQKGYLMYSQILARKLYDFYTDRKDNTKTLYYSRQLVSLHDKQDKINNASGIDYIDYALKEEELQSSRLQSKYQTRFLILACVICIMALVIIIILWRDRKNVRRTAKMLRSQFVHAEATSEALDTMNKNYARLIKIVAHDLRNPVGAVSGISSILAEMEHDSEANEMILLMQASANNCLKLINELLETDFDQRLDLNKEEIYLDELLRECVQMLNFKARDKNQQLIYSGDNDIKIRLDKEKIGRVINNLIMNAIKFSHEGSDIFVDIREKDREAIITVKDTGIGIPVNIQNKIFDPFTMAKREGTNGEQAFGLGLYISKQIVEAHYGTIGFKSVPGKGASFFIELPLHDEGRNH